MLLVSVLLLITIFIFDVIRTTVPLDVSGFLLVREALVFISFACIYFFVKQQELATKTTPRLLLKLLLASIVVLAVLGIAKGIMQTTGGETPGTTERFTFRDLYAMFIASYATGVLALLTFVVLRQFIFFKRKKWTRRNFYLYGILLLLYSYIDSPFVVGDSGDWTTIAQLPIKVLLVILSFRQSWIVFLSKKEKLYTLLYSFLLFAAFMGILALISPFMGILPLLRYFSTPLYHFGSMMCGFGAVYFGITFVSTLFHFPTAEMYERKQAELHSLHNLSQLITQVFDFQKLVTSVTRITREVCGAESAWLEMYVQGDNNSEPTITFVALENISEGKARLLSLSEDFRKAQPERFTPLIIDDIWTDRRTKHLRKEHVERLSLVAVPLLSHGEVIGALYATKNITEGFYQDDLDVLAALADHGSIAIENARLIAKSLERERLQQEMLVAQQMQRRLFPQKMPSYPEFDIAASSLPSYEVGGDYYDIVSLDTDTIGIAIGDVSGKGVSAAFYMAELKGIFLALSPVCTSPKEFLIRANTALAGGLDKKSFISFEYAILNRRTATMTLARAGHCPALYLSSDGVEVIRPNGLGLGLTQTSLFETATEERVLPLQKGDIIVFFTDGVLEARKETGEEYGLEQLIAVVQQCRDCTAEALRTKIQKSVLEFLGESPYRDDLTMIVLKWLGK